MGSVEKETFRQVPGAPAQYTRQISSGQGFLRLDNTEKNLPQILHVLQAAVFAQSTH